MASTAAAIRQELRQAGLTGRAIDAVWPQWWSEDAESSVSAATELRYTLARRLGISPRSLFDGPPKFVWREEAKFKSLTTETPDELAILASYGLAVGRAALSAITHRTPLPASPLDLRAAVLQESQYVGLTQLVALCWGVGIPALSLRVFPLPQKRMHAMTVRVGENHGVLIGRESHYPAQAAYVVAHELGHIALNHVRESVAVVEMADPMQLAPAQRDDEEDAADRYALALLTGEEEPQVTANFTHFNSTELAQAAIDAAPEHRIDPGVIVMCLGHATGKWKQVFAALKKVPDGHSTKPIGESLNEIADHQLDWTALSEDGSEYLRAVLEVSHADDD